MNERRRKNGSNNYLSPQETIMLIEQLEDGNYENLYTRALLQGSGEFLKRTDLVISFYPYLFNPMDIFSGKHVSEVEEENIRDKILNLDISDQTQFVPRINDLQESIKERHFPAVILEYGTVGINDIEVPKKYILLYHTIDLSTGEALQKIKSVIF